ncbi:hypothetical protein CHS0354_017445 [Potamilus streckersoni]|uniref:Poly [ADP-ribose] polymerase n=1 Tax=Potamilus streckersoni TaxID=2493646 RepID=A0AAE0SCQ6_9BIVA|nr:hypothetical protein CHS0354_017445 [Potamilus streckersoni]
MGKKRIVTNEGGDAGSKIKKEKLSCEIDGQQVRWEWEGDKEKWMIYSDQLCANITEAYNNKKTQVNFEVAGGVNVTIKLDTMVQKNKKTGWERVIRAAVKDNVDDEFYVWQWEDEKGKLKPYDVKVTLALEKARESGETTVDIVASHRSYSIDISKMEQRNTVTDLKKKVCRNKSEAEEPESTTPTPVASTSASSQEVSNCSTATGRKARSSRAKIKVEPEEQKDEEEKKPVVKSGKKSGKRGLEENNEPKVKTVILKGKAPVDSECTTMVGKAHVYYQGSDVWDSMLNQTNVSNNNNKYFIIQLLEEDEKKKYHVWFRWGRVGYKGQNSLVPCGSDLEKAKKTFTKKFYDKTKNEWSQRNEFVKVQGKYDLLQMDYSLQDTDEPDAGPASKKLKKEKSDVKIPESKLEKKLQDLINLICDVKNMEEAVMEMKYDAKKAPLGKLTKDQIKAGYAALKKIDACIEKEDFGNRLKEACDDFYTRIPHDFGMRPPSIIRTKNEVKSKIQLLEALGDIEIALNILKKGDMSENPVDRHYHSLKCDLKPLDHECETFKLIDKYLKTTHARTHNQYKMKLLDVFDVDKEGEAAKFSDCGNRMLLWHGSRLTNWVGILSQGLRIAPPEAPVTGYMFGKGIYFADMSSKSANYCFPSKSKDVGILVLCDVALGNCNELLHADYNAHKLPAGKHSVKGLGSVVPNPESAHTMSDGCVVPLGNEVKTSVSNPKGFSLNYNEYIVYNTDQVKMKYLVQVQFDFK